MGRGVHRAKRDVDKGNRDAKNGDEPWTLVGQVCVADGQAERESRSALRALVRFDSAHVVRALGARQITISDSPRQQFRVFYAPDSSGFALGHESTPSPNGFKLSGSPDDGSEDPRDAAAAIW